VFLRSLILLALLGALDITLYARSPGLLAAASAWSFGVAFLYFRMESTGRISGYRTFYFASLSVFFLLNMHLSGKPELAPYCHLSMAGNLVHEAYNQVLGATTGAYLKYGALSAGVLWLLVVLVNGGGFCSWVCFFGGVDDALSRIPRRPLLRIPRGRRLRDFQLAGLVFFAFVSFVSMEPEFCLWVCPFKLDGEILNPNSRAFVFQTAAYVAVGTIFLVILPVLSGKRTFCSTVCPFGAIAPLIRGISPYRMTVNADLCNRCGHCETVCPSFAIERDSSGGFHAGRFCVLCGRCADACPRKAVSWTVLHEKESKLLPFVSMCFGGALSLFYVPGGIVALVTAVARAVHPA
jgi:polyferredoxin